jgi:hypothetical protein
MAGLTQSYPDPQGSLQYFHATICKYLVALSESQGTLREIYASLFQEDLTIQPIECKEAIDALKDMHELVQECSNLLTDSSLLPMAALAPRYRLLFASQLVLEQTRCLIELFKSYQVMCLKSSPEAERTHKKLQEVFQAVLKYISDIPRQALYFKEESKSLEQELMTSLREESA